MMTPLESELGWAAGIVDGEGCIRISKNRMKAKRTGRVYETFEVSFSLSSTTRPLLDRFVEICGGGGHFYKDAHYGERYPRRRSAWSWRCSGQTVEYLLNLLSPYLFLKKPQAFVALEARRLVSVRGVHNPNKKKIRELYEQMKYLNRTGPRADQQIAPAEIQWKVHAQPIVVLPRQGEMEF